jgi:hypothetical protein
MGTIWKFMLRPAAVQTIRMPKGSEVLTAQVQGEELCLWAMVDPDNLMEDRMFLIVGTGHNMPEVFGRYVATVQMENGLLIWHIFEGEQRGSAANTGESK